MSPSITRRKPMSGKQKKEQLKQKREEDSAPQVDMSNQPRLDPENYFLKFVNDSDNVVQQNKNTAHEQFTPEHPKYTIDQTIYLNKENCPDLPFRPDYRNKTPEEYKRLEKETFDAYFKSISPDLATIATEYCMFEINTKVYAELWRVCERSDLICIITDARFPLCHIPCNVLRFLQRVGKPIIVMMNKADLVSNYEIQEWSAFLIKYIHAYNVKSEILPFSAQILQENEDLRLDFIRLLLQTARRLTNIPVDEVLTCGFIGQPSVGKSRTLNALMGEKVCRVKLTAGCTKHLQTHYLRAEDLEQLGLKEKTIVLCDCPGLVFPVKGAPRCLQVATGVFPTGRTREFYSSTRLICENFGGVLDIIRNNIDLSQVSAKYSLSDKQLELNSAGGILGALAFKMGYIIKGGFPWDHRAGLWLFKKVTEGSIPYEVRVGHAAGLLVDKDWKEENFEKYDKSGKTIFEFIRGESSSEEMVEEIAEQSDSD